MQRMRGFRGGDLAEFSLRRVDQLEKKDVDWSINA